MCKTIQCKLQVEKPDFQMDQNCGRLFSLSLLSEVVDQLTLSENPTACKIT